MIHKKGKENSNADTLSRSSHMSEARARAREVLVAHSIFDPEVFKMNDGVLMCTKAANRKWTGEVWQICLLKSMVRKV